MDDRRLVIPQHLLQRVLEHCLEEKPYEACGILTGREGRVRHAYATDNSKRSPVFYEVDQAQQELVLRTMAERGEELVGIYHSHPTSPAVPSSTDIKMAVHYPEACRVIVSLVGPADIRAFQIQNGRVRGVKLVALAGERGEWHDLRGGVRRSATWPNSSGSAG